MSMASVVEAVMGTLPRRPAERPLFRLFEKKKAPEPAAGKPFSMIQSKPKPKAVRTFTTGPSTHADEGKDLGEKTTAPRDVPEPPAGVHLPGSQGGDPVGGAEGGLEGWEPLPVSQSMPDVVELVLQNRTKSGKLKTLNEKPKASKNKNKKEAKSEVIAENSSPAVPPITNERENNETQSYPESTERDSNESQAEIPSKSENDGYYTALEESKSKNIEVIPENTKENGNSSDENDKGNTLSSSRMSATPSAKSSASGQMSAVSSKRRRKANDVKHYNGDFKNLKSVDAEIFGVPLHSADTKKSTKSSQSAGQKSLQSLQSLQSTDTHKKSTDGRKSSEVLQSASTQKSFAPLQSAETKRSGGTLPSAQSKRSVKSVESTYTHKSVISMESVNAEESVKSLQSADAKKSNIPVRLADGKKSDTPVQSAGAKKSNTTVQSEEAKKSGIPVQSAGAKKSDTPVQSADAKKSDTPVQSADAKKSDTAVQSTDAKKSDTPVQSADAKKSEKSLNTAGDKITSETKQESQKSAEEETPSEGSGKSTDSQIQRDNKKSVTSEANENNKTDADKMEENDISGDNNDNKSGVKTEKEKEISDEKDSNNKDADKAKEKETSREKDHKDNDKLEEEKMAGKEENSKDADKLKEEASTNNKDDLAGVMGGSQNLKDNSDDPAKGQGPQEDEENKDKDKEDKENAHKSPTPQDENKTDSAKLSETMESNEDKEKDSGKLSGVSKSSSADAKTMKEAPPAARTSVPSSEAQVFTVDIPLSFEEGVPRLQSPKLMSVETENGIERRRSLIATTAEENYLLVHGQSRRGAISPSSHTSEAIPDSQGNQSSYKNHSQETWLKNTSNSTNRRADIAGGDVESQSTRSTRAGVDQSITADGAAGGTTGVKDSGGKSTAGTSSRSVTGEGRGVPGDSRRAPLGVKTSDDRVVRVEYDTVTNGPGYEVDHLTVPSYGESYARRSLPSVREDVLVEALAESARSYSGDLSRPLRRGEYAMPFPDNPRGTSLSSVEVPEGSINTVSLAVSKNGSHSTRPMRDHGGGSLFDRFNTGGGSLWQKSPQGAPLVVKPSGVVYSREPKEYEDYLPRESKRPPLQRRGSLGRIAVHDDYYDAYDDPPRQTWSKPRESRGSQTVRVKNEQPHHSILKKKAPEEKRDARPSHRAEEHNDVGPIIIASGLVPKNLESYTSEYQAAVARNGNHNGTKGSHGSNGGHGPSGNGNGNGNGHHHTSGNGNSHYHTSGNNGYGTGGGNSYHTNGSSRTTTTSRSYPVKERDHFQERYFDHSSSVTAPLIAPQPKQSVGDVFDRLHRNVKPEHTQRKPEIKPKPKPPPPATQKTNTTTTKPPPASLTTIVKDPVDRGSVVGSNTTTTTSASSKGSSGGGDVFTRLYENAPSRKRPEKPNESSRLLDVPEGAPVTDSAPNPKRNTNKSTSRSVKQGSGKGDAVINMPL
ncbi:microtubule-associated protein futsch-like [Penaeus japonicus]|uniref:microtubule-associated protein futsch-like n=1 Tax=Penaeus japonicus TaxID=27405 RepID=UPI001C714EA0|nr:microtubule-associated protein futsch-like [Penaeus japonicus]